ncbi:hypothetical protein FAVG1_09686 [Fusarium avenaceum]|nr:hypothetical protein FAVG1_09686 [Fusarium avenaceum]
MHSTIFITIEESASGLIDQGQIEVILSFHNFASIQDVPTTPLDSVVRKCSPLSAPEEIQWYFHDYSSEPFSTIRAKDARNLINNHASLLLKELRLHDTCLPTLNVGRLVFQILEGPNIFKINWEVLESLQILDNGIPAHVCRFAKGCEEQSRRAPINSETPKRVNVLLLVARLKNDTIDPYLISRPLVQALNANPSCPISIDIARPGTLDTLKQYLQTKDYDVVHLDLHGHVQQERANLSFQTPSSDEVVSVNADDVGHLLFVNRVKLVVMNACQSASTMGSSTTNFASQLASHGVPYVLGMAYKVTDTAARIFILALYGYLLWNNRDILSAVREARANLRADTKRDATLFGLSISLQDDMLPVLYASYHQLHKDLVTLSQFAPHSTPAVLMAQSSTLLGRGLDMLKVQNQLITNKMCIVHGLQGVGKRTLINHLAGWLLESHFIGHIYHIDFSQGIDSLDSALKEIYGRIVSVGDVDRVKEDRPEDLILESIASRSTLLTIENVDKAEDWLADLCLKLLSAERSSKPARVFVLISSTNPLASVHKRICQSRNCKRLDYELKGLGPIDAMSLAGGLQDRRQLQENGEKEYSVLWYHQRILDLLEGSPLAMGLIMPQTTDCDSSDVYWGLKAQTLDLALEGSGAEELFIRWQHLLEDHSDLLKTLMPFINSVPGDYLSNDPAIGQDSQSAIRTLIQTGCAKQRRTGDRIQLHPLFVHFARSRSWSESDVKASWHRAAVYYQSRSIAWIRSGLYSTTEPKQEWENLTTILGHLIPTLESDTEESSLFDLSWIVSSFYVFHKNMAQHAVDMFADLTLKAVQAMIPSLLPTTNDTLRIVIDNDLHAKAKSLSDFQILRVTLLVQFLVQYYYDISPDTAIIYQDALIILQGPASNSPGDEEFAGLLYMASSISLLTRRELTLDLQIMPDTKQPLSGFPPGVTAPSAFQAFADMWNGTQDLRFIGYHVDPVKTLQNQANHGRQLFSILESGSPEEQFHKDALEVLSDTFETLNTALPPNEERHQFSQLPLDVALKRAIGSYDLRSQLDIYDKLVEVYFTIGDWDAVLMILGKIDDCSRQINLFRGIYTDEITTLRQMRWMTIKRAQCFRYLGKSSESRKQVRILRDIVAKIEELWTRRDRSNEEYRNLMSFIECGISESSTSDDEITVGNFVFRLRRTHKEEMEEAELSVTSQQVESHHGPEQIENPTSYSTENLSDGTQPLTATRTLSNNNTRSDETDDLYLITNPWMAPILEWMDSLGGVPVTEYYDFQVPPGRIGGLFFYQSRNLMVEEFLRTMGILEPRV